MGSFDFRILKDGDRVTLFPNRSNPLHGEPVKATYQGGFFFCDGSPADEGPDYTPKDVVLLTDGFELLAE